MHWLPTNDAIVLGCVAAPAGLALGRTSHRLATGAGAVLREVAMILGLYALWGYAGAHATLHMGGAVEHGRWLWDLERTLHLPSELSLQHAVLPHPWLVQLFNRYYAFAHVPSLITFLVWLFAYHRDRYPQIRNTLALLTGGCLAIQMIPLAPPRLVPGLGFVDTANLYHQSVYPPVGSPGPDQFSAMPSLHVGWAAIIAIAVVAVGHKPIRLFVLGHFALTFVAVAATANHWWLDGVAAIAVLGAAWGVERLARRAAAAVARGVARRGGERDSGARDERSETGATRRGSRRRRQEIVAGPAYDP